MQLMTVEEAASTLAIKTSTLRKWISQKRVPIVRVGERAIRIRKEDIEKMIQEGFRQKFG